MGGEVGGVGVTGSGGKSTRGSLEEVKKISKSDTVCA